MSSSRYGVHVFLLFQNNVWLRSECIRYLAPKERNGATYLHKWGNYWCAIIKAVWLFKDYLLDLHKVCRATFLVDSTAEISCSSKVTAASSYQKKRKFVTWVLEILKVDRAVDDRHDPLLSLHQLVHVTHQKVIPHHLVFPWLMFLDRSCIPA